MIGIESDPFERHHSGNFLATSQLLIVDAGVPGVWANKRRRIETILNEAVDTNRAADKRWEASKG